VTPQVLRPGHRPHGDALLCDYGDALALMESLILRPASAPDLLLSVQHPPTITLGRRGGREHVHGSSIHRGGDDIPVDIWDVARGGSVTYHAPGQLVLYPIVRLTRLEGPIGRGPLGDLPAFVRMLEVAMQETCATFGLRTIAREGFAGLWVDERSKIASIGVGIRHGWSFHGLALNVCPHLEGFDLVTPCGLDGVRMTTLWRELDERALPRPSLAEVEAELIERVVLRLVRNR
jgi:lipoate-protein ligase B